jgi:hypothetical protein
MGKRFERYKLTHKLMASATDYAEFRRETVEKLLTLSEKDAAKALEKLHTRFLDITVAGVTPEVGEKLYASFVDSYNEARKERSETPHT